eukprot:173671_1
MFALGPDGKPVPITGANAFNNGNGMSSIGSHMPTLNYHVAQQTPQHNSVNTQLQIANMDHNNRTAVARDAQSLISSFEPNSIPPASVNPTLSNTFHTPKPSPTRNNSYVPQPTLKQGSDPQQKVQYTKSYTSAVLTQSSFTAVKALLQQQGTCRDTLDVPPVVLRDLIPIYNVLSLNGILNKQRENYFRFNGDIWKEKSKYILRSSAELENRGFSFDETIAKIYDKCANEVRNEYEEECRLKKLKGKRQNANNNKAESTSRDQENEHTNEPP